MQLPSTRAFFLLLSVLLVSQIVGLAWKSRQNARASVGLVSARPIAGRLWKRDGLQDYHVSWPPEDELVNKCDSIYEHEDRCTFVREYCADFESGILNYIELYFCSGVLGKIAVFTGLVAWLFFLFGFVGIAASDFFCPNLQTIASSLNLSESMAGVTFLAFGNGSPDVFSTFSAMKAQSGSLAIGELIGAASFIASVVAGSMAVVAPFRVSRLPFLRDLSFFMCAILIVVAIVWDGKIYLYESVILIAFYAIYVAVVVVGNVWWRRNHEQRELMKRAREGFGEMGPEALTLFDSNRRAIQSRMNMSDDDEPLSRFYDDEIDGIFPSSPRPLSASSPGSDQLRFAFDHRAPQAMSSHIMGRRPGIRPSFFGAIEFRDVVHSLEKTNLRYGHPNDQYRTDFRRRYSTMPANIDSTRPHFLADPQSLMARPSYAADAIITAARTGDDYFTSSQIRSSSPIGEASGTDDDMDLEESSNIPRITVNTITSLTPPGFSRTTFPSGSPLISPLHSHRPISRPISPLHPPSTPLSPLLSPTSSRPMSPYPPHESHLLDTRVAKVAHVLALEPYDLEVVLRTLFPSLQGWTEKSMSGKITSLVATPILLVLRLTLPVVDDEGLQPDPYDYEDEDGETAGLLARESANNVFVEDVDEDADGQGKIGWCQWLTALQLVFAPVFVVTVLATDGFVDYIAIAWALLGGALAMLLLLLTTRPQHRPPFFKLVSFVGFAISITWIYIIANEVVGVLQAIGHIVGLSEAILGLTVFAMGNSLGDFVANVTIAKMGSPMMAISACFGGPMLNILLGVGISATYMTSITGEPYSIVIAPTILVSSAGLLVVLFSSLVLVPKNGYKITKNFGYAWIAIYTVCSAINVLLEIFKTN